MRFLVVVFAFVVGSEALFAQHALLSPSSVATVSIIDGKVVMTEIYTAMVPETRSRRQTYTVTIPTDDGAKSEVRSREVPYTVMVPYARERVVSLKGYELSLVGGKKIDLKTLKKRVESHGKTLNVVVLNEGEKLSKIEKSLFKDTAVILYSKVAKPIAVAPTTRGLPSPEYAPAPASTRYAPALPTRGTVLPSPVGAPPAYTPAGFPIPAVAKVPAGRGEGGSSGSGSNSSGESDEPTTDR